MSGQTLELKLTTTFGSAVVDEDRLASIQIGKDRDIVGHTTLMVPGHSIFTRWRKLLFAVLMRNANDSIDYLGLPTDQVVEVGVRIEI